VASAAKLDPATGEPIPQPAGEVLARLERHANGAASAVPRDVLQRTGELAGETIADILRRPREQLRRAHHLLPLPKVRNMDVRSLNWLARQPGRNLREKLGDPALTVLAVEKVAQGP
jgi:hypothetical protein